MAKKLSVPKENDGEKLQTKEDWEVVDQFCQSIEQEEISYEQWSAANESLDICLFLFVSQKEISSNKTKKVKFTRIISKTLNQKRRVIARESAVFPIHLSSSLKDGYSVVLEGKGDILDSLAGRVKIVVRVK